MVLHGSHHFFPSHVSIEKPAPAGSHGMVKPCRKTCYMLIGIRFLDRSFRNLPNVFSKTYGRWVLNVQNHKLSGKCPQKWSDQSVLSIKNMDETNDNIIQCAIL